MTAARRQERRTTYFRGRVQGVGFRYTTQQLAADFPITGYVQNLADGRVLLVAEGETDQLDRFLDRINQQMGRFIETVESDHDPATGEFDKFRIRY